MFPAQRHLIAPLRSYAIHGRRRGDPQHQLHAESRRWYLRHRDGRGDRRPALERDYPDLQLERIVRGCRVAKRSRRLYGLGSYARHLFRADVCVVGAQLYSRGVQRHRLLPVLHYHVVDAHNSHRHRDDCQHQLPAVTRWRHCRYRDGRRHRKPTGECDRAGLQLDRKLREERVHQRRRRLFGGGPCARKPFRSDLCAIECQQPGRGVQ